MKDLVKEILGQKIPATYFRGKIQIDGIWSTKDIYCHTAIFIPLWSGIVDKTACVLYFTCEYLVV